jgi:hypothetical protein
MSWESSSKKKPGIQPENYFESKKYSFVIDGILIFQLFNSFRLLGDLWDKDLMVKRNAATA